MYLSHTFWYTATLMLSLQFRDYQPHIHHTAPHYFSHLHVPHSKRSNTKTNTNTHSNTMLRCAYHILSDTPPHWCSPFNSVTINPTHTTPHRITLVTFMCLIQNDPTPTPILTPIAIPIPCCDALITYFLIRHYINRILMMRYDVSLILIINVMIRHT